MACIKHRTMCVVSVNRLADGMLRKQFLHASCDQVDHPKMFFNFKRLSQLRQELDTGVLQMGGNCSSTLAEKHAGSLCQRHCTPACKAAHASKSGLIHCNAPLFVNIEEGDYSCPDVCAGRQMYQAVSHATWHDARRANLRLSPSQQGNRHMCTHLSMPCAATAADPSAAAVADVTVCLQCLAHARKCALAIAQLSA
jgi:hypothetical protein